MVNRRFVPIYFDLDDQGAAADPAARAFVISARPELGAGTVPTPNVLLMTSEGQVIAELDPYLAPEQFLAKLLTALKAQPDFARASIDELALRDPLERARLAFDLSDLDEATRILETTKGSKARYLAGHIARLRADGKTMAAEFARVDSADLAEDLRVERAHHAWITRDFASVMQITKDFPPGHRRCSEVLYLRGMAHYHLGSKDEALATWLLCIQRPEQDAWIYRADWAYTEVKSGRVVGAIGSSGVRTSPLGRIGYMGRANPDLVQRPLSK